MQEFNDQFYRSWENGNLHPVTALKRNSLSGRKKFCYSDFHRRGKQRNSPQEAHRSESLAPLWEVKVAQLCPTLCGPMVYTVHGILQARILEWVALPFSRRSFQPRYWTQVSHIAGRFFTSYATREAQEYGSGWPIPSPGHLPDPGIEPGFPASQADSLPAELPGKLKLYYLPLAPSIGRA